MAMKNILKNWAGWRPNAAAVLFITMLAGALHAQGRQQRRESSNDAFPDYNRLEMHPQMPDPNAPPPPPKTSLPPVNANVPPAVPPAAIPERPAIEDPPIQPARAVPVNAEDSEPPLPDEIVNTLRSSTTAQDPLPAAPK